ncbi:methionine synthase [Aeromicrobium phragmitis]|uniref:Methionine synthase n=1 Tax=Aeromicrobium phragmitis TaxID=2478914 RepID=A0A3L8PNX9_9ACTN|nr:methionine synthase [Aeromicrobium phragmitis]RLV56884.1 methionine synthase [Aeromicrobium phragmitis]
MRATGVGSMPGEDYLETLKVVTGELSDLAFVPELPARGAAAGMIGRTLGIVSELAIDLQPAGWRLAPGDGVDHRRSVSLLARDLDAVEEHLEEYDGAVKQQITGPLTLAASVALPRGERVLADHGARRDLAGALAEGVREHLADLRRRFPGRELVLQIDEPGIQAVLTGSVSTSSGFGRYRTVHPPEADALLRSVVEAATDAGATPVVHCCAAHVPVALLAGVGFAAIGFDLSLARPDDAWAEAFEQGVDLWLGSLDEPAVETFMRRLGYEPASYGERSVITPPCGLAGSTPAEARRALADAQRIAARF